MPRISFFISPESFADLRRNRSRSGNNNSNSNASMIRRDCRDYFEKFVYETNLHGIRQAFTAKSRPAKCFWALLCLSCMALCLYEISQVILLYYEGGTATKISYNFEEKIKYPTVMICPVKWISSSKVRKSGLRLSQLQRVLDDYIIQDMHLMMTGDFFDQSVDLQSNQTQTEENDQEQQQQQQKHYHHTNSRSDFVATKKDVSRFMSKKNFTSYEQLILSIAMNAHDWISCECCNKETIRARVTLTGVCYVIDLCTVRLHKEDVPVIQFTINQREIYKFSAALEGGFVSLYDRAEHIGIKADNLIYLTPNIPTTVKLELSEIIRRSTPTRKCRHATDADYKPQNLCEFDCVDKILNRLCRNCSLFSMFNDTGYPQCHVSKELQEEDMCRKNRDLKAKSREQLTQCQNECLPPCNETRYSVNSVMSLMDAKKEAIFKDAENDYLKISFQYSSFAVTRLQDVRTIYWDTFIGSLGGQASLWCGASIISLIQLFSYCFCPCVHMLERKGSRLKERISFRASARRYAHNRKTLRNGGLPTHNYSTEDDYVQPTDYIQPAQQHEITGLDAV